MAPSSKDRIYTAAKVAVIVDLLAAEGVPPGDALQRTSLSYEDLSSPATRVSAQQVLQVYGNAIRLSGDPHFAVRAGRRFHVSAYGMYGFAILSAPGFRESIAFSGAYHQLATPLVKIGFAEQSGKAAWTVAPAPNLHVEEELYRFLVDLQLATHLTLHRDVMGAGFTPELVEFSFEPPQEDGAADFFGCPVRYGRPENRLVFDAAWLDRRADLGNGLTYAELKRLCDKLLHELQLGTGIAGKVREILLAGPAGVPRFEVVARQLSLSERNLRRRLHEEGTSFRVLVDELRAQLAIRYLRETDLGIEDIAFALGFSDASSFRHAFRRWTNAAPQQYRPARDGR